MKTTAMILLAFLIGFQVSAYINRQPPDYRLEMLDEGIRVIDPLTEEVVYEESYETESRLCKTLLTENE